MSAPCRAEEGRRRSWRRRGPGRRARGAASAAGLFSAPGTVAAPPRLPQRPRMRHPTRPWESKHRGAQYLVPRQEARPWAQHRDTRLTLPSLQDGLALPPPQTQRQRPPQPQTCASGPEQLVQGVWQPRPSHLPKALKPAQHCRVLPRTIFIVANGRDARCSPLPPTVSLHYC